VHRSKCGSLESICAVYESTLQFPSLAYESIAGGWLDLVENRSIANANGIKVYEELTSIFRQVTSPFVAYQHNLAQLEAQSLTSALQSTVEEIHGVVADVAGDASLEGLQQATDRLQSLSLHVFPLVEGALARFELLTGGYQSSNVLSSMDKCLSTCAGELALAIRSLSADETSLAESFDESHVLCALEVLKIAGAFPRHVNV
jgi:hypothetical protein